MVTETDGIILRQTKLADDRRMLVLYTRKFGKISASSSIQSKGKNKNLLALRVFTHGRYELFKGRSIYSINSAETIESYFKIGEDIDKYMAASYALEFTDKVLTPEQPSEKILDLLLDFLRIMSVRKSKLRSFLVVYQWKLLTLCGYAPHTESCTRCDSTSDIAGFSVVDGGAVCEQCIHSGTVNQRLLYNIEFDILNTLKFIEDSDIKAFEKLALGDDATNYLEDILKAYVSYHMDIHKLKSESYLTFN